MSTYENLPSKRFPPGTKLLIEGQQDNQLFFLIEGEVSVTRGDKEVARVRMPGAVFGEMSALLEMPYSASVVAVTEVRAYASDNASAFIEANPSIAMHLARTLAQRLHNTTGYLADIKQQFSDHSNHLGMLDEVLDELLTQQKDDAIDLTKRADDPRL